MKYSRVLLYLSVIIIITFGMNFFRSSNDIYFEIAKNIEMFNKIYKEATVNYVDDISPELFMKNGINGMLESLDPYSQFIDNSKKGDVDLLTSGRYGGIGVSIGIRNNEYTITEVIAGYSAHKQGIRTGDVIIEINDLVLKPEYYDTLSNLIRGEPGTEVKIKIKREGETNPLVFNLIREEIQVTSLSFADFINKEDGIVYLKLDRFSRRAGEEIKQAIKSLNEKGEIKFCILDLRNNPGGLLESAVEVLDKFVPEGEKLVETRGRIEDSKREYFAREYPILDSIPLAILINESSASASEIVAGCIQDLDRGVILGTQSFGKGLVQTVLPINYNSALKLTTAKYYTPSGRCIQKLDYMHSSKGAFTVKPDSMKNVFYTKNKRKVFEAGGITPDSSIKQYELSPLSQELLKKNLFFKFATAYYNKNTTENFEKTGQKKLVDKFLEYLKSANFTYEDAIQQKLVELSKMAEENKSYSKYSNDINKLKEKIKINLDIEISANSEEIYNIILSELLSRSGGEKERIRATINFDTQLKEAMKISKNKNLYKVLLSSK